MSEIIATKESVGAAPVGHRRTMRRVLNMPWLNYAIVGLGALSMLCPFLWMV